MATYGFVGLVGHYHKYLKEAAPFWDLASSGFGFIPKLFSQDPVEAFFSRMRYGGGAGSNSNFTVKDAGNRIRSAKLEELVRTTKSNVTYEPPESDGPPECTSSGLLQLPLQTRQETMRKNRDAIKLGREAAAALGLPSAEDAAAPIPTYPLVRRTIQQLYQDVYSCTGTGTSTLEGVRTGTCL
eukprot:SAG31_NODE_11370_length_1037_cov_11.811301_1_plen_184_part_00